MTWCDVCCLCVDDDDFGKYITYTHTYWLILRSNTASLVYIIIITRLSRAWPPLLSSLVSSSVVREESVSSAEMSTSHSRWSHLILGRSAVCFQWERCHLKSILNTWLRLKQMNPDHAYISNREDPPPCLVVYCKSLLTIEHIMNDLLCWFWYYSSKFLYNF